jgi:hypothetical protein
MTKKEEPEMRRKEKKVRGPSIESQLTDALELATKIILGGEGTYGMTQIGLDTYYRNAWDGDIERLKGMRRGIRESRRKRKERKSKK